mmetsp:Transcript_32001/g.52194  ORF Transcript_32001/g.52194 Transcript_32001/m.52194 type:complete len:136 (+) Transcript_32001:227-634(+)
MKRLWISYSIGWSAVILLHSGNEETEHRNKNGGENDYHCVQNNRRYPIMEKTTDNKQNQYPSCFAFFVLSPRPVKNRMPRVFRDAIESFFALSADQKKLEKEWGLTPDNSTSIRACLGWIPCLRILLASFFIALV